LPGRLLVASHLWALRGGPAQAEEQLRAWLHEDTLVGSGVAGGEGAAYTDFAVHADGFSRIVLLAGGLSDRRLGRTVQRLLELETYRMAALLGLPAGRSSAPAATTTWSPTRACAPTPARSCRGRPVRA